MKRQEECSWIQEFKEKEKGKMHCFQTQRTFYLSHKFAVKERLLKVSSESNSASLCNWNLNLEAR